MRRGFHGSPHNRSRAGAAGPLSSDQDRRKKSGAASGDAQSGHSGDIQSGHPPSEAVDHWNRLPTALTLSKGKGTSG